jgi:hypothetical protein
MNGSGYRLHYDSHPPFPPSGFRRPAQRAGVGTFSASSTAILPVLLLGSRERAIVPRYVRHRLEDDSRPNRFEPLSNRASRAVDPVDTTLCSITFPEAVGNAQASCSLTDSSADM